MSVLKSEFSLRCPLAFSIYFRDIFPIFHYEIDVVGAHPLEKFCAVCDFEFRVEVEREIDAGRKIDVETSNSVWRRLECLLSTTSRVKVREDIN